jgi:hypothetical protein
MPKKTRKPEPQTPSLALNTNAAKPTTTARTPAGEVTSPEASGIKAPDNTASALPDANAMAHEIYRLALEQKDCAILLRLAEVLYPEKFVELRENAKVRKAG